MDEGAADRLRVVVARYGRDACTDRRRAAALVRDMVVQPKLELSALVAAAEEGVPAALLAGSKRADVVRILQRRPDLTPEAASWAVETWRSALALEPDRRASAAFSWESRRTAITVSAIASTALLIASVVPLGLASLDDGLYGPTFEDLPSYIVETVPELKAALAFSSLAALVAVALQRRRSMQHVAAGLVLGVAIGASGISLALLAAVGDSLWAIDLLLGGWLLLPGAAGLTLGGLRLVVMDKETRAHQRRASRAQVTVLAVVAGLGGFFALLALQRDLTPYSDAYGALPDAAFIVSSATAVALAISTWALPSRIAGILIGAAFAYFTVALGQFVTLEGNPNLSLWFEYVGLPYIASVALAVAGAVLMLQPVERERPG